MRIRRITGVKLLDTEMSQFPFWVTEIDHAKQ